MIWKVRGTEFWRIRIMWNSVMLRVGLLVLAVTVAGLSCSSVRKLTYPQEIVYLDRKTVTGTMHTIARSVFLLDELSGYQNRQTEIDPRVLQEDIVKELENLQNAVDQLNVSQESSAVSSNHPLIDRNIDQLNKAVAMALHHAQSNPPNYFWTGRLTGSCSACHVPR